MAITRTNTAARTFLDILNRSYDRDTETLVFEPLGFDGVSVQRTTADAVALKLVTSGNYTYICIAAPGTAESDALWQIRRLDSSSGLKIEFADGNGSFDNVATDPTSPSISYS